MSDSLLQSIRELTSGGSFNFENATVQQVVHRESNLTIESGYLYVAFTGAVLQSTPFGFYYINSLGSPSAVATCNFNGTAYYTSSPAVIVMYIEGNELKSVGAFGLSKQTYSSTIESNNISTANPNQSPFCLIIPRRSSSNYIYTVITHFYFPPFDAQKEGRLDKMSDSLLQSIRGISSGGSIDFSSATFYSSSVSYNDGYTFNSYNGYIHFINSLQQSSNHQSMRVYYGTSRSKYASAEAHRNEYGTTVLSIVLYMVDDILYSFAGGTSYAQTTSIVETQVLSNELTVFCSDSDCWLTVITIPRSSLCNYIHIISLVLSTHYITCFI